MIDLKVEGLKKVSNIMVDLVGVHSFITSGLCNVPEENSDPYDSETTQQLV